MIPSVDVSIPAVPARTLVPRELNPAYHRLPLLERYEVDPETGCWNWLGYKSAGYGQCNVDGKKAVAHRVFYRHHIGDIPPGLDLDHLCRNRACVNPDHLEPVTRAVNTQRGAATKLTRAQADEIRDIVDGLCARYGVKPRTLAAIGERRIWKPEAV